MEIDLPKLFDWDAWASTKVMEALAELTESQHTERAWQIMAHLTNAQLLWLTRLDLHDGRGVAESIWPEPKRSELPGYLASALAG